MGTHSTTITDTVSLNDRSDLEITRALKPYLAKALTLNHDINNPLCAILGYAEFILGEEHLDPDLRSNVEHIMRAGEKIRALVDALSLEKIQANEKVDLTSILNTPR